MIKEWSLSIIAILIVSIFMEPMYTLYIMNTPEVDKEMIPFKWFKLLDKDQDYIEDSLEKMLPGSSTIRAIVVLSTPPTRKHIDLLKSLNARIIRGPWRHALYGFSIEIDPSKIFDLRNSLLALDVNKDGYSDLLFIQSIHKYDLAMHYASRHAVIRPLVWDHNITGKYVGIAVLDSGVDVYAPGIPLSSQRITGYDATNTGKWYIDEWDHGTHIVYILVGSYNGSEGLLPLSSEFIGNISSGMASVHIYLKYPIPVFSQGKLLVNVYVHVYDPSFTYEAYLCRVPSYADPLQAGFRGDIQCIVSNNTWDLLGNDIGHTRLEISIDNESDYGNYVIGLRHNYIDSIDAWVNAWTPSKIASDHYNLSQGIAPDSKILMIRIVDGLGNIYSDYIVDGIDYILSVMDLYNISVVNMSFEGQGYDAALELALLNAFNSGLVLVAAAGNRGASNAVNGKASNAYPAAFPWVISVAAVDGFNNITYYSSQGGYSTYDNKTLKPDVAALGGGGSFQIYSADSNNEDDFYFNDTLHDLSKFNGTSASTAIVSGIAALIIDVFRAKPYNSTHSLWDVLLKINASQAALIVKYIIEASTYETYPLVRTYNGTDLSMYSPSLDRGGKDVHEGFGIVDGYAAIKMATHLSDFLAKKLAGGPSYPYDYVLGQRNIPFINYSILLRNGTLYGVLQSPYCLNFPFNSSVDSLVVHFEDYSPIFNDVNYQTIYGLRLRADTVDPNNTDFDIHIYLLNFTRYDIQLLNNTIGGYGIIDEILYFRPPKEESNPNTDFMYLVTVKRATEASAGGKAYLYIGPGLTASFMDGRFIWINATAVSPSSIARYALVIMYYNSSSGPRVYRESIMETSDLNGFANVNTYIDIGYGLNNSLPWFVCVFFTRDKRDLSNLTMSSIVEGPVIARVSIGEPTSLIISSVNNTLDNTYFNIIAKLSYMDTDAPIPNATIYFYRSDHLSNNLSNYVLIGTASTNASGYAFFTWIEPDNGTYYYIAEYRGDTHRQYSLSNVVQVYVYMRTIVEINLSSNYTYTVKPITVNVSLKEYYSREPISGEQVDLWISYDNGTTWILLFSGETDSYGEIVYSHIFASTGTYLLKANYSGNTNYLLLPSQSSIKSLHCFKTPTTLNISYNGTGLKVYDNVVFTIQLNYTYNSITKPIALAPIYLELWNSTSWIIVDRAITDKRGYTSLSYMFQKNGSYIFRLHYIGNETFKEYVSRNYTLIVETLSTIINILDQPHIGHINKTLTLSIKLIDERDRPLPNETVRLLKLNDSSWIIVDVERTNEYGEALFNWIETSVGNYTYKIVYDGRKGIYRYSETEEFNISIYGAITELFLTINKSIVYINETILLKAQLLKNGTPVTGEVILFQKFVNDSWITIGSNITDSNGYAMIVYCERYAGTYMYRAFYPGSILLYRSYSDNMSLVVKPISTEIILDIPSTEFTTRTVVMEAYLTTGGSRPLSGYNVSFWISTDGASWILLGTNITDGMGRAVYRYSFWKAGKYFIKAYFTDPYKLYGKWVYGDSEDIKYIEIIKTPIEITLSINYTKPYINESVLLMARALSMSGYPLYPATLNIYINDVLVYELRTNSSGYVSIELRSSVYSVWNIYVEYTGNETYELGRSGTIAITWNPLPTYIELYSSTDTIAVGSNLTLIACIRDEVYDKPVRYYRLDFWKSIDGTKWVNIGYAFTDSNGCALLFVSENIVGQYMYKANFSDPYRGVIGKWIYLNSNSNNVSVNVISKARTIIILSSSTTKTYVGSRVKLYALLLDPLSDKPLVGYEVIFYMYINDTWKEISRSITNKFGIASTVIVHHRYGNYSYKAVFKGSDLYKASESKKLVIRYIPKPVFIQVRSVEPSEIIIGDSVEISIRLFSMDHRLVNKTVILSDGENVLSKAITDINGEAILLFHPNEPGIYPLYIVFPGDEVYRRSIRSIKLVVRNPVYLELNVSYIPLSNGSILIRLTAYLTINQRPFPEQVIEFYKGISLQYLGNSITDSRGIATLTYLEKYPSELMVFSANYTAKNVTLTSASDVERIYITIYVQGLGIQYVFIIIAILLLIIAILLLKQYRKGKNLFL